MIMSLPANVGFGRVTGRLIRAILDGPIDTDTGPDGVPIEGAKVIFTASVNRVVNRTATPPVSIFIDPVTVVTNSDGILVSPDGTEGVTLVASDDADLNPSGWTYKVTMTAPSISALSWSITVPEGSVQDLATAIPVPANLGTAVAEWKQLRDEVLGYRDDAREDAESAAGSSTDAASSASAAAISESNAATAESNAATSESNAATSESHAASSASAAAGSATSASSSATAASGSANAAASAATTAITKGLASGGVIKAADDATLSAAKSYADSGVAQVNKWFLRGTGSPMNVVTPTSAGVQYVDLAATNGARVWISTGATASAWQVINNDTVVRNISDYMGATSGQVLIWRDPNRVNVWFRDAVFGTLAGTVDLPSMPSGFTPPLSAAQVLFIASNTSRVVFSTTASRVYAMVSGAPLNGICFFMTNQPWPTTLPGTPA